MPDYGDLNGVAGPRGVLDSGDYTGCGQEQDHNDENRNDCPCEFQLVLPYTCAGSRPSFARLLLNFTIA